METFFDWGLFLPAKWPHQLLLTGINDTGDLSALFIWVIIATFVLVSVWLVIRGTRAFSSIRFLNGIAEAASSENLAMQRRDLRNLAAKRDYEGQLWKSFDASWVESADGGARICQTLDSAHFFNTATLAKGISENRLVAAIPGILTAFGILGTFVGLQIGLSSLDLSSPQVLTQSIVPLIKGAAVAFSTSVWGTAASVIFNFLEKSIEQAIGRRINHLQNRIDNLFVRHLSEQTLINIERANVEAENALKGLAEQIGERLQEVMHEVPKQIQAGIEASITPAGEKLVAAAEALAAKQGDSAQEGLSALIENFMQGV
ncbi:MAG: anti-phage defense ZorAB system ZorA, partial [Gammaproteobacteria bacterium]|nr:anti-phage defense ZorAB system ZorA [Gammaproteobacteria bacterium]